jgi:hypothetical protein
MLNGTAARLPEVYRLALKNLTVAELAAFGARLAGFAASQRGRGPAVNALPLGAG